MTTLGARIKAKRLARGKTLQQIADVFEINRASVSDWERGNTRPDIDRLVLLAETLHTSLDYLVIGEESDSAASWPFEEWIPLSSIQSLTREQLILIAGRLQEILKELGDGKKSDQAPKQNIG